ncbi:MAG TPA: hypothetical protein VLE94_20430 [Burkholderiaceae bacterium]|nr:hypothetical protein [Burkholderiaceae bacterium]
MTSRANARDIQPTLWARVVRETLAAAGSTPTRCAGSSACSKPNSIEAAVFERPVIAPAAIPAVDRE